MINSEYMLSRMEVFNKRLKEIKNERKNWDWRKEMSLIGTDVVALFPSLSAERTVKSVRRQAEKSEIIWENVDYKWLSLYIHLNRDKCTDIEMLRHLLPVRRKGKRGREPGLGCDEIKQKRYLENEYEDGEKSSWIWPPGLPTRKEISIMQ